MGIKFLANKNFQNNNGAGKACPIKDREIDLMDRNTLIQYPIKDLNWKL